MNKPTFSGHDSFECRHFWLKKGYDHISNNGKFNDEAVIALGVGRNMVTSIRYWMKAFALVDEKEELTPFAHLLFAETGHDRYLEDEGSLWLLHFYLVISDYASIYSFIFNELRKQKPEFSKEHAIRYVQTKTSGINENTLGKDFEVFTKMYVTKGNDTEENFDGILTELNLVEELGKEKKSHFLIRNDDRQNLPSDIILYCILKSNSNNSIDFETLLQGRNSVGTIFCLSRNCLADKLEEIATNYRAQGIVFSDHAGLKELQFTRRLPNPEQALRNYYNLVHAN